MLSRYRFQVSVLAFASAVFLSGCGFVAQSPAAGPQPPSAQNFLAPAPGVPQEAYRDAFRELGRSIQSLVPLAKPETSTEYEQQVAEALGAWSQQHVDLAPAVQTLPGVDAFGPVQAVAVNSPDPLCLWFNESLGGYEVKDETCAALYQEQLGITLGEVTVDPPATSSG